MNYTDTIAPGTRALDVLHVASALELGARTLVTYAPVRLRWLRRSG